MNGIPCQLFDAFHNHITLQPHSFMRKKQQNIVGLCSTNCYQISFLACTLLELYSGTAHDKVQQALVWGSKPLGFKIGTANNLLCAVSQSTNPANSLDLYL